MVHKNFTRSCFCCKITVFAATGLMHRFRQPAKKFGIACPVRLSVDNDCHHDSHQIPLSMNIDFTEEVKALNEIQYNGRFTLPPKSWCRCMKISKEMKKYYGDETIEKGR